MRRKNIFVLDDEAVIRLPLISSLKGRGFNAEGAANVNEARALLDKLKDNIDVMVLDMRLEDPEHPHITGADIGLEARDLIRRCPPEFLILSGYKQVDYYEYALKLDVAAYLVKTEVSAEDVIRHIQSLALRRALSFEKPEIDEKIREIAEVNSTPADAVANFCRKLLAPEIKSCIGIPAVFLLTDANGTRNCSSDVELLNDYNSAYSTIQALAQGELNPDSPFVVDVQQLSAPPDRETCDIYEKLDGGAFLPLFVTHGLRLSIGLLQSRKNGTASEDRVKTARSSLSDKHRSVVEDPIKIASILSGYLRPAILEHLFRMLSLLTESNTKREILLKHTARFCSWVGQEQSAILVEAEETGEVDPTREFFQKFKALSTNLRNTGESLSSLFKEKTDETLSDNNVTLSVVKVITDAWRQASEQFNAAEVPMDIEGEDFSLQISHRDLFPAALRVFQWMAQRRSKISTNAQQRIKVTLARDNDHAEIIFTDQSRRLGERLRSVLFDPFTQAALTPPIPTSEENDDDDENDKKKAGRYFPLFLAKMLVEVKYNGALTDKTGTLESEGTKYGHRFVMSFPLESEQTRVDAIA